MKTEKRKIKFGNKIVGTLVLLVLLLFIGYSAASENNSTSKFVEKISEIEIWAKTFISLEATGETIGAVLSLDNGTEISEQELDFYLDESFLEFGITNSEGYVEVFFGDYNLNVGNYSFKSIFQGNETLFFNASSVEKQIEILNQDGIKKVEIRDTYILENATIYLNETNLTILNETNDTVFLADFVCEEFTDNILFSSGYTSDKKGSINYETWKIQTNCTEAGGRDCLLFNINTKSRVLYLNPYDEGFSGEGYVQISELGDSDCGSPEKEKEYTEYIAYDTPDEDNKKWKNYCGKNNSLDSKCDSENSYNQQDESTCYGIKVYASQYSIVDVVEIKYTWCWEYAR